MVRISTRTVIALLAAVTLLGCSTGASAVLRQVDRVAAQDEGVSPAGTPDSAGPSSDGVSPPSASDQDITPEQTGAIVPLNPVDIAADVTPSGVVISWAGAGESLVVAFEVDRSPCCTGAWQPLATVAADGDTLHRYTFVDQTATPGAAYQYAVQAINRYNPNTRSEWSVTPRVALP